MRKQSMDVDVGVQVSHILWINWSKQVVSFHCEEGFEPIEFQDHDEMLQYVFQKTSNGFRIQ